MSTQVTADPDIARYERTVRVQNAGMVRAGAFCCAAVEAGPIGGLQVWLSGATLSWN